MSEENKNKLDAIVGKTYNREKKRLQVTSYKEVNSLIVVLTTNGTYNFYPKEIEEFIASLELVEDALPSKIGHTASVPPTPEEIAPPVYGKTATHIKLETSLNDMIDKVMDNKEAIPQAAALCNLANTMINLEKQQINLLKAANKL